MCSRGGRHHLCCNGWWSQSSQRTALAGSEVETTEAMVRSEGPREYHEERRLQGRAGRDRWCREATHAQSRVGPPRSSGGTRRRRAGSNLRPHIALCAPAAALGASAYLHPQFAWHNAPCLQVPHSARSFLAPRVRVRANLLSDGDKRRDAQQILVQDLVPAHRCRRQQTALYVYLAAGTSKRPCTSLRHGPFTSASRPVLLQEPPRPQAVDAIACRDYRDPRALLSPKFEPTPLFAMKVARA